jgi:hypothetical protein
VDAGVLVGVLLGDLEGVVGGSIIPQEESKVWIGLAEDRFDRLYEVSFPVVDGDNKDDLG